MRTASILALVIGASAPAMGAEADFFVSTAGSDRWSGALEGPNASGTDGPFASLARALEAVREARLADPGRTTPLTVLIRGGTYELAEPLRITPEHSGTAESPTVIAAYPDETPILSGGRVLQTYSIGEDGHWTAELRDDELGIVSLWVNGVRRSRPRLPKSDYYTIAGELPATEANVERGADRFVWSGSDIDPSWSNLGDVEILPFHLWTMSRMKIAALDPESRTVTFSGPTASTSYWAGLQAGHRYIVENVREALSEPGEYYVDRTTGQMTYLPTPTDDFATSEIVVPRLPTLVEVAGDPAAGLVVEHLVLRGLSFSHTGWSTPSEGYSFPQAEFPIPSAFLATGLRDSRIESCRFERLGGWGVELGRGCKRNTVEGCLVRDLGAGGVKLGETSHLDDEELVASDQTVRNCLIECGGRTHPAGIGVWVGQSYGNTVLHNTIRDFYYTGISLGWSWGYAPSHTHHNEIAWNEVSQIGQRVLSDMGGIYTLGLSEGTTIHHNVFRDIRSFDYGGWGIYFDEGTTHLVAEDNLVFRTWTGGFHQHYGKENTVRNNIFAFSHGDQFQRTRIEEHQSFTFERNLVVWSGGGPLCGSNWNEQQIAARGNLYWRYDGQPVDFRGNDLAAWQAAGMEAGSLVSDPLFAAPEEGDFTLGEGSPALNLGFVPFDLAEAGCSLPEARATEPAMPAFPLPQ